MANRAAAGEAERKPPKDRKHDKHGPLRASHRTVEDESGRCVGPQFRSHGAYRDPFLAVQFPGRAGPQQCAFINQRAANAGKSVRRCRQSQASSPTASSQRHGGSATAIASLPASANFARSKRLTAAPGPVGTFSGPAASQRRWPPLTEFFGYRRRRPLDPLPLPAPA